MDDGLELEPMRSNSVPALQTAL